MRGGAVRRSEVAVRNASPFVESSALDPEPVAREVGLAS
jgi:hypothetical protein